MYHARIFLNQWIKDNPQYNPDSIFHWTLRLRFSAIFGLVFLSASLIYALFMPIKIIEDILRKKKV